MNDYVGLFPFDFVFHITINYCNIEKEDLFIGITKIVDDITEIGTPLGFETNIISIPNFISHIYGNSYFKKINGHPLIYFKNFSSEEEFSNYTIDKEQIFSNIHYKYNFRIQPFKINQTVSIQGKGTDIYFLYPEELNFSTEEIFTIRYIMPSPSLSKNITLNPNLPALECVDLNGMKNCFVPIYYFIGEKSGYYYTYHLNHDNKSSIYYSSPIINVTLPEKKIYILIKEEDNFYMTLGENGLLYFITSYNDSKTNIFNESDIQEKTVFNSYHRQW